MSALVAINSATRPVVDPRRESKNDDKSLQRLNAIVTLRPRSLHANSAFRSLAVAGSFGNLDIIALRGEGG